MSCQEVLRLGKHLCLQRWKMKLHKSSPWPASLRTRSSFAQRAGSLENNIAVFLLPAGHSYNLRQKCEPHTFPPTCLAHYHLRFCPYLPVFYANSVPENWVHGSKLWSWISFSVHEFDSTGATQGHTILNYFWKGHLQLILEDALRPSSIL